MYTSSASRSSAANVSCTSSPTVMNSTGAVNGSLSGCVKRGVSTTPGYTTSTLMLSSQRSIAIASENTDNAAFDASYADSPGDDNVAATDDTLTTRPPPRSSICGSSAKVSRIGPRKL